MKAVAVWDPSTLPQGVREAVSRRLSRLPVETNKALAAAAVVGSRFAVDLVERVVDQDLVDAFDEACKAGIVIEEPGGRYRFNHALVRQSLLAELPSVRRMRLHQRIATTLETESGADDELLAELAHHYFECAWAGNAAKAVEYCRRAADQAMARLAYEGAADLYDHALHALEEIDDELPDREDQTGRTVGRPLRGATGRGRRRFGGGRGLPTAGGDARFGSPRGVGQRASTASCRCWFIPSVWTRSNRRSVRPRDTLAELDDAAGEAKAHTVRAAVPWPGSAESVTPRSPWTMRSPPRGARVNTAGSTPCSRSHLLPRCGVPTRCPARAGGVSTSCDCSASRPAPPLSRRRRRGARPYWMRSAAAQPRASRMIESARRTVSELGMRHAMLEVEQFAGIVELVADDPAAAEPHLRQAYNGFRRMGLDADTAETAALLGRACLALDRDAEADELCSESERLAGHALKASIAWRTVRAQLLSRSGDHDEARRVAEEADRACRAHRRVGRSRRCLPGAGDGFERSRRYRRERAAAERAAALYELKGAAALADNARQSLAPGKFHATTAQPPERPAPGMVSECTQVGDRLVAAVNRAAWAEAEQLIAPAVSVESRRKIVGFSKVELAASQWPLDMRRYFQAGMVQYRYEFVAARGERLALVRLLVGTADKSPGAPYDEFLQLSGIDEDGRIMLQVWFDIDDIDAAIAELDSAHAALDEATRPPRLENAASRMYEGFKSYYASRDLDALGEIIADDVCTDDRRRVVNAGIRRGRDAIMAELVSFIEVGAQSIRSDVIATRGDRLILNRSEIKTWDQRPSPFDTERA